MSALAARNTGTATLAAAPTPVRRCAIYTRKSTSAGLDKDFNSLEAQREACESYIRAQAYAGWQVLPDAYDDGGFTGANLERPAFRRLFDDVEAGRVDVIVVYKVDRLSRSLLDFARVMDRLNRAGVAFVSVTQNFSTADAIGRLTLNMLMSFGEFEREMIAERTRDKVAASRRRGKWTGGPVPIGYDVQDGKLVINELEAIVVREVFDLYREHGSALVTARALNARGRRTKLAETRKGELRGAKPWHKDAVLRVLKSPLYAGYVGCGGELFEGEQARIVERDVWARVQAMLLANAGTKTSHGRNPDYVLRGLLFCQRCGAAFTTASTRKRGNEYRYYRCVTRVKAGADACEAQPLPANAIESYVVDRLRAVVSDPALVADIERRLQVRLVARRATLEAERKALPATIANLSAEGGRLVASMATMSGPARRLLDDRVQQVGDELARREEKLREVEQQLAALAEARVDVDWVAEALRDFDPVWEALTPDNRGRLLAALICRIDVDEPAGRVEIHLADVSGVAASTDDMEDGEEDHE